MVKKRDRQHIQVPAPWRSREPYRPHGGGGPAKKPGAPPGGRPAHAAVLKNLINLAENSANSRRISNGIKIEEAYPGIYLEFVSFPGWELTIGSLENRRSSNPHRQIEVVAVSEELQEQGTEQKLVQRATVFVPQGEIKHFLQQLERYEMTAPKQPREKRYEDIYDRVLTVRLAALRALWTDSQEVYPSSDSDTIEWEIWLRRTDGKELKRLEEFAEKTKISLGERRLQFDDRIVVLALASPRVLATALDVLDDIAELQKAKETATFFVNLKTKEQAEWVIDLVKRTKPSSENAPSVCILDTGVNAGHPLLKASLDDNDCHACDPLWGTHDHQGHGTQMAGLALYGDLVSALAGQETINLLHRLESVKILPPRSQNTPELYGAITADAISRPEIQAPSRHRIFSMAITSIDARDRGKPTSWSAAVDALAAGRSFDASSNGLVYFDDDEDAHQRLFVISAGNIDNNKLDRDYLTRSDVESIHDPAQAWNALTIGAFTEKVLISDISWNGWSPVAAQGDLSPWSTTSLVFGKPWPLKPDVVFEGGNVVYNSKNEISFPCEDLCLLTTYFKPAEKPLELTWATSAACSQAARMCAQISAEYPEFWPETLRALMVHSAEWTPAMLQHLNQAGGKTARGQLVRRYGFGVPNIDRALRSAANSVTLIVQDTIRPFDRGKMREIHLHRLPWPTDILSSLGATTVRIRITLSYFIEPNPGRRGWQTKHRYQSHGLRFELKGPTETLDEFHKRLNQIALGDEESRPSGSDNDGWYLGTRVRDRGSLHSDILTGTAADIAERDTIAVFPVTGWWKEKKNRDRSDYGARYALIVSIEPEGVETDIWTPINNQILVPVSSPIY